MSGLKWLVALLLASGAHVGVLGILTALKPARPECLPTSSASSSMVRVLRMQWPSPLAASQSHPVPPTELPKQKAAAHQAPPTKAAVARKTQAIEVGVEALQEAVAPRHEAVGQQPPPVALFPPMGPSPAGILIGADGARAALGTSPSGQNCWQTVALVLDGRVARRLQTKRRLHGEVVLRFTLNQRGEATKIHLEQSHGSAAKMLESLALASLAEPLPIHCPGEMRWPVRLVNI